MSEPVRIGILGAARISDVSLLAPAADLDVRLVAVAARDRGRAERYAADHGIETVHDTYADVIADPRVEAVYNPLPNSMHAPWNLAAIEAGKHVLSEKPFASNASEAERVHLAAGQAGVVVLEGFHYLYHPQFQRLADILTTGVLGELERLDVTMAMPAPAADDLRWSWPLSGGALMDLGCYCLHATRSLASVLGGDASLVSASAHERAGLPQVDESFEAEFALPGELPAFAHADMASDGWDMSIRVTGSTGSALVPDFIHPQDDDRLLLDSGGERTVEHTGSRSTYSYQLEAFAAAVRNGRSFPTTTADSLANMTLIDSCYRAAGLLPRGTALTGARTDLPR